jgi:hypothetical protein
MNQEDEEQGALAIATVIVAAFFVLLGMLTRSLPPFLIAEGFLILGHLTMTQWPHTVTSPRLSCKGRCLA